jgi:hypothetical protein
MWCTKSTLIGIHIAVLASFNSRRTWLGASSSLLCGSPFFSDVGIQGNVSAATVGQIELSEEELKKLTTKELKVLLKESGLPAPKRKAEMIKTMLKSY